MKWIGQQVYDFVATFRSGIIIDGINITTIQSSSESFADNDTSLMTSAAIDDRINTAITAEDLDLTADSGTAAVDLDSQALAVTGGTGITTSATGQAVTINVDADQSGITSLGTLTGLVIDGDKSVTPGDGAMLHIDTSIVTDNSTSASGTASLYTHARIEGPTLAASNVSVTTTNAATLYVTRPTAGDNQTVTNGWGIYTNGATLTNGLTNNSDYTQDRGDMTLYDANNDANPTISIGSSATERLEISARYESGAQGLDEVRFTTYTAGSSANDGRFTFHVDETNTFQIKDSLVNIMQNGKLTIGNVDILTDSSGTTTLNNIDALDDTTESTIESAIDTLSNLTSASSLATIGTITTGVWQGTAIASAYLDADTAHYSATRQATHHMILDDIDSSVVYISLLESDAENTSATNKHLPLIAPGNGKLLKIFLRTSVDQSSETFTFKLYTRSTSASTGGTASEIGAQSGTGPTNSSMVTYDFTSSLDSGTNAINAGDKVLISLEAGDGATANGSYFITCLWEWDLS